MKFLLIVTAALKRFRKNFSGESFWQVLGRLCLDLGQFIERESNFSSLLVRVYRMIKAPYAVTRGGVDTVGV